jgi:hypothetical protein
MMLYKNINVSPIQEHPYQTRYGGAKQTKFTDEWKITTDIIRVRGYVTMFICKDLQT